MKSIIVILLLVACTTYSGVIDADVYINFEHGTNGNIVTAGDVTLKGRYTNRITSITVPTLTTLAISSTGEHALPQNISSGNVIYGDDGTRGWAWTNTTHSQYVQLGFNTGYDNISCGYWFRMSAPYDAGGGNYSYTGFKGGGYAVHAFVDNPSTPKWVVETVDGDGNAIPATTTDWVWVTMVYHRNSNAVCSIYTTNGTLIGSSTNTTADDAMTMIQIGREDAHPHPADINFTTWMDDVIIDFDGTFPLGPFALTNTPASLAIADVQSTVNSTPNGGIVKLPAGATNWTSQLTITNGIWLIGSGSNSVSGTIITNGIGGSVDNTLPGSYLFHIHPTTSGLMPRVSSLFINANNNNIFGLEGSSATMHYRIDHCYFYNAYNGSDTCYTIWAHYAAYGVIDHCIFLNCDRMMRVHRDLTADGEWASFTQPLLMLGSTNTSIIEDCSAYFANNTGMAISGGQALHYTFRYNSISGADTGWEGLEAHGNSSCDADDRGSLGGEIYKNTFTMAPNSPGRAIRLRGGMWMVYSNTITSNAGGQQIQLTEEESIIGNNVATACFGSGNYRTNYPAIDQITNSFFWGNTGASTVYIQEVSSETFIQQNRDYWLRAPQSGDAVENYAALTYPHPRVTAEDGGEPAEPTYAIIPQNREATNWWRTAGASPTTRSTVYTNVVTAGAIANDLTDDSSIIQACINACPSNQVVYIPSGRYVMESTITMDDNGITLRGDGPGYTAGSTILAWTNTSLSAGILVTHSGASMSDSGRSWTAGFTRGTTNITIASGADYPSVGDVICMDQETCLPAFEDGHTYHSRDSGHRVMQQFAKVYSVATTSVTLDRGLVTDFTNTATAEVVWFTPTKRVSIEQITLDTQGLSSGNRYPLAMNYSDQCWATNIECRYGGYANVYFDRVIDCELTHSYMHELQQYAQRSAGIDIREAHGCKIEDNIFVTLTTPIYVGGPGSHNVYAYNYMTNCVFTPDADWMTPAMGLHSAHNWFLLFEGNKGWQIDCDNLHGSASHCTFHRNSISGYQANKDNFAFPFSAETTNWFMNVVGNALGTSGFHDLYKAAKASYGSSMPIYRLGFNAADSTWDSTDDPDVDNTILIHGNYDTVTSTNSGIVWGTNSNHTLLNSYYLSSKPSWFGNLTWPQFNSSSVTAAALDPTNIPAGYRYIYGSMNSGSNGGSSIVKPGRGSQIRKGVKVR
jgi:hypothetical protein